MKPGATPDVWDATTLFAKAQRYLEQAADHNRDDWQRALWASLSLELLARAALSNVSPALLADTDKSWSSLYHALGFEPKEEKFAPKSIAVSEVFRRLSTILPEFTKELENFGIQHTGKRNAELHSGALAFDGVQGSSWQPRFYRSCEVLLKSMGKELEDLVDDDEAKAARALIAAAADEGAKAVRGDVDAHQKVWSGKGNEERKTLVEQADLWARRQLGHRVNCPACASRALVVGDPIATPVRRLQDEEIIETQEYLPNRFECIACGLKISGLSRLQAVGLGDRYKRTLNYDAAEYYAPEDEHQGYEEDNNEW
jgi:hypothetical protein